MANPQTQNQNPDMQVEGEGSRTGTRQYDEHLEQFVRSGKGQKLADEAKRAVDDPEEGEELRRAEEEGKRHAASTGDTGESFDDAEEGDVIKSEDEDDDE